MNVWADFLVANFTEPSFCRRLLARRQNVIHFEKIL
jgi:hypothetical protein